MYCAFIQIVQRTIVVPDSPSPASHLCYPIHLLTLDFHRQNMDNHDSFPCGQDDGRLSIVSSTPTSTLTICETNLCKFQDKPVATTSSSSNACYPSWRIRLSVPKSLTLQQLTSKGPIGRFLIQRRLGRIAFRVYRDQKRLEQKDLWDLLELLLYVAS